MPTMYDLQREFSALEENPGDMRAQGRLLAIAIVLGTSIFGATAYAVVMEVARITGQNADTLLRVICK